VGLGLVFLLGHTMNRFDAYVGMRVVFGRADGEQALGRIVAVHQVRAKVETLESRADRPAGTLYNVPYHLMQPANHGQALAN